MRQALAHSPHSKSEPVCGRVHPSPIRSKPPSSLGRTLPTLSAAAHAQLMWTIMQTLLEGRKGEQLSLSARWILVSGFFVVS